MSPRASAIRLSGFFFGYFLVFGVMLPYWPVWLKSKGLSATEIGFVVALTFAVKLISNPLVGSISDRRGDRKKPMILLAAITLALHFAFFGADNFLAIAVLTLLATGVFSAVLPLGDNMAIHQAAEHNLDYGRMRLWGSIAFIIASTLGGFALDRFAPGIILWLLIGGCVVLLLANLLLPDLRIAPSPEESAAPKARVRDLLSNRVFITCLAASGLLQMSHMVYYGFSTLHWQSAGLSNDLIGLVWSMGVLAEVCIFAFSGFFIRRFGPIALLIIGGFAGVLRWSIIAVTADPAILLAVNALHGLSFGANHLASMHFLQRATPKALSASAQSIHAAVTVGVVPGLGMMLSGPLYNALGGHAFFASAVMALAGALLAIPLLRMWNGGQLTLAVRPIAARLPEQEKTG